MPPANLARKLTDPGHLDRHLVAAAIARHARRTVHFSLPEPDALADIFGESAHPMDSDYIS